MILYSLALDNVFSIKKALILFEDYPKLTLVTGFAEETQSSNGAGKSTLISKGLLWTLYGETAEGLKGDSVLNGHGPAEGTVIVNGCTIYRKRDTKGNSKLELQVKGVQHTSRKMSETQKAINDLLGADLKTFVQTNFFGQGRNRPYAQLVPKEQKEILEEILPIDDLETWVSNAKINLLKVQHSHDAIDRHLLTLNGQRNALNSQTISVNKLFSIWELGRNDKINQLQLQIKQQPKAAADEFIAIKHLEEKIDTEEKNDYQGEISKAQTDLNCVADILRANNKHIEPLNAQIQNKCPTCLRPYKKYTKKEIDFFKEELQNLQKDNEFYNNDISLKEQIIIESTNKFNHLLGIKERLTVFKHKQTSYSGTSLQILNDKLTVLQVENNPHKALKYEVAEQLRNCDNIISVQGKELERIDKEIEDLKFWEKTFNMDFRAILFEKVCPFLEERTKIHLDGLNNSHLKVKFSTIKILKSGDIKEDFNVKCWNANGAKEYQALSGGEKQIVDFAIGLSLSDLANMQAKSESNLLILDEPFVSLDHRNCESVVNYLHTLDKNHIFVISNDESMKGLIPKRIHVHKDINGVSSVRPS